MGRMQEKNQGKKTSKEEDSNASSNESVHSSSDGENEPEYTVERVVDRKYVKGKVSKIGHFASHFQHFSYIKLKNFSEIN